MIIIELLIVLIFIYLGAKMGGIGIGLAGGAGVLFLSLVFGLPATQSFIPIDVILIIMAVVTAIAAMQVAGGLDWIIVKSEKFLRKNPSKITFYAPIVTYLMTIMAGTGHTAFAILPVIAELAKEQGIRPSRPLSIAVVASQIAVTASPISAAVIAFTTMLTPFHIDYLSVLAVCIPATFLACMFGAVIANFSGCELQDDPIYQERLAKKLITLNYFANHKKKTYEFLDSIAKKTTIIFVCAILVTIFYATIISKSLNLIVDPNLERNEAIITIMLTASMIIVLVGKINISQISGSPIFQSGMTACICVLGVAWLGSTFVNAHINEIKYYAGNILISTPWMLAFILFFASMILYSQGATTVALMPTALAIGVDPVTAIASFAAVSALFVLPTYPTLLAAISIDSTGSTRIGKYIFNHSFFVVGIATILSAVLLGFFFGELLLK